ncbi:MBL fold metallo-hydrolase RNA specificity domain-containing protein [Aquisalimonas sp. APHAB1-3]|uniref:MBL fold metallo-hydrolase RNA specificity domain-containing protein n=1 Tax=Aquisalimonas sp. APHAB1-3 TaxID=3402080 RepID=UPI003AAADDD3
MATVSSFGAAGEVTGSMHLADINGLRVLIDCGLFQGEGEARNHDPFPFDPRSVDVLILTHAHLDHIGRVPLLYKHGFSGTLITTPATYAIAREMLADSANVLQAEARARRQKEGTASEPLYDADDVARVLRMPNRLLPYHVAEQLMAGVRVTLYRAGHILGSAMVELTFQESAQTKRLVFSGDIGRPQRTLIPGTEALRDADTVFVEATYGDRENPPLEQAVADLESALRETTDRGGIALTPAFALSRTQELIYLLSLMEARGTLEVPVYVDTPLGIRLTALYPRFDNELKPEVNTHFATREAPFRFPGLQLLQTPDESMALNRLDEPAIIIAGAGMCEGGRIGHHFRFHAGNPDNSVVFVGYQVPGTKGRRIVDGEPVVPFHGADVHFRARIIAINGLSAHGDAAEITRWIGGFDRLGQIHLIHGEPDALAAMRRRLREELGHRAHIVVPKEHIHV